MLDDRYLWVLLHGVRRGLGGVAGFASSFLALERLAVFHGVARMASSFLALFDVVDGLSRRISRRRGGASAAAAASLLAPPSILPSESRPGTCAKDGPALNKSAAPRAMINFFDIRISDYLGRPARESVTTVTPSAIGTNKADDDCAGDQTKNYRQRIERWRSIFIG